MCWCLKKTLKRKKVSDKEQEQCGGRVEVLIGDNLVKRMGQALQRAVAPGVLPAISGQCQLEEGEELGQQLLRVNSLEIIEEASTPAAAAKATAASPKATPVSPKSDPASPQSGGGAPELVTSPAKNTQCGARCQRADPSLPPRNAFGTSTNLTSPGDKLGSDAPHQPGPAPGLSFAPKRLRTAHIGATTLPNLNIGAFTAKGWTVHDLSGVSQPSWTRHRG